MSLQLRCLPEKKLNRRSEIISVTHVKKPATIFDPEDTPVVERTSGKEIWDDAA